MTFAENVKSYRHERGLSQSALSEISTISTSAIARIEAGIQDNPRLRTLKLLAKALRVSINDLVGE